jgi:hypothetical protein
MTTTADSTSNASGGGAADKLSTAAQQAAETAQRAADTVAGMAGEMTARFPEAASSTREAFDEANRMVRSGSDETLKVVGALSLGFATGLLVGGANRILVIAALAPAALIGSALIERMNGAAGSGRSGSAARPVQRG